MMRIPPYCTGLVTTVILICTIATSYGQLSFTQQAGGFGPFIGRVVSNLGQPMLSGQPEGSILDHQGWEFGLKSEIYRTNWLRGNLMASYIELGAKEWIPSETDFRELEFNLKAIKAAIDPLIFKVGDDFIHGYIGGGIYGTFFFDQELVSTASTENYVVDGDVKEIDFGLDLTAGVHIWSFDLEFHAQYGARDIGQRFDGTGIRQEFYGIHLAYLYVNQNVTRKTCRNKNSLKRYKK